VGRVKTSEHIKTQVSGRLIAGIAGSNPAGAMVVRLLCRYSFCNELVTRSEEPYQVCVPV